MLTGKKYEKSAAARGYIPSSVEEILFMLHREAYEDLTRHAGSSDILPLVTPKLLSDLGRDLIAMGAGIVD